MMGGPGGQMGDYVLDQQGEFSGSARPDALTT